MKTKIMVPKIIDIRYIKVELHIRYEDEDIPYDFPLRKGDMWNATINLDTQTILDWPQGQSGTLEMKVCDEGGYRLFDENMEEVAELYDYVPHGVIPGSSGDYVKLVIDENGKITNMRNISFSDFFPDPDDY